ncbi:hypothetical protein BN8_01400 [Fibrisoma limi BUZ 3]|uniref:Uncharacterized protein n=1 Tax=Fibrisoma limi BUZ 3 TaxID=1185876 RepID=I2GES4_9BACT|nr:hypothetical protein BN8_01400 [Fibrisoma limi BUZ 3]
MVKALLAMQGSKLSSLQLELLKVYSFQPSDEDLIAVRKLLATYFSDKMTKKIGQAIDEKGIKEEDLERWLNE